MSVWPFAAAGLLSATWLAVHLTVGERQIARPMLASRQLDEIVRETIYVCWHFTSVSIACMAGFFTSAAVLGDRSLAAAGLALACGFALSGVGVVLRRGASHVRTPQGWLFVPVAALGVLGLSI